MAEIVSLALANLMTPAVLFFALGAAAGFGRSDLELPEAFVKALSIYLLLAIGYKGGAAAAATGLSAPFVKSLVLGVVLSAGLPFVAFAVVRMLSKLDRATAAAVSAHYGSISIVTFVAAMDFARVAGVSPGGYLPAVAAAMETPGIIAALFLAGGSALSPQGGQGGGLRIGVSPHLLREVLLNGSVVVLVGAFVIGLMTGERHAARLDVFVNGLFAGALCLFLLEMGVVAARRLRGENRLTPGLVAVGIIVPALGAGVALLGCRLVGVGPDDGAVLMTLAASASYIAAPAAMRIALPEADPGVYLPLSIGISFPFNIVIGIPIYFGLAGAFL